MVVFELFEFVCLFSKCTCFKIFNSGLSLMNMFNLFVTIVVGLTRAFTSKNACMNIVTHTTRIWLIHRYQKLAGIICRSLGMLT